MVVKYDTIKEYSQNPDNCQACFNPVEDLKYSPLYKKKSKIYIKYE